MKMPSDAATGREEFRRGWPTVSACLLGNVIGLHILPPYTVGLFMEPLMDEFGWSRIAVSLGITTITLGTAVAAPLTGLLTGRFGERVLIAFGSLALAIGYLALSLMNGSLTLYYAIMLLMALLGAGCSPVTFSRLLISTFDRRRGTALGVTLLGTGITGTLAPLLLGPILRADGWRSGYQALAIVMAAALPLILSLLIVNGTGRPSASGAPADVSRPRPLLGTLLKDRLLLRLLLAFFVVALAVGGVVVHFVSMLNDADFDRSQAAQRASLLGIALIAGRLLTGIAIDRAFAPKVAALFAGLSAVGFAVLAAAPVNWVALVAVLVGLSLGSELDLIAYLASRYFRASAYGGVFGVLYAGFLCGVALSPVAYALLREHSGTYAPAFAGASVLLAIGAALFATLPRFTQPPDSREAV